MKPKKSERTSRQSCCNKQILLQFQVFVLLGDYANSSFLLSDFLGTLFVGKFLIKFFCVLQMRFGFDDHAILAEFISSFDKVWFNCGSII